MINFGNFLFCLSTFKLVSQLTMRVFSETLYCLTKKRESLWTDKYKRNRIHCKPCCI